MKQTTFLRVLPLLAFGAIPVAADVVDTYSNQSAIQWSTGNDPGSASSKTVSFGPGANSGVSFDITFATNQGNLVTRPYVSKNFLSDSTGINGGAWFEGNLTITVNNFSGAALDDIRFRLVDFSGRSLVTNAINFTSTATPTTAEISLGTGLTDNPFTDVALDSNVANMAGGTYTATLPWKVYDPESSGLFEDFSFEVTVADPDTTPPTITSADIADDVFGGPIIDDHGPMTYTLSFSEAMSPGTITLADFENAGTASASIDAVNPTLDPAVFEVKLTPNSAGTLLLQIKQGALLEDIAGNDLDTGSAITDSTTITVNLPPPIITSLSPANGATGVAQIGSDLVIVFGETVVKGSGNIVLRTAGMTVQTIDVNSSSVVLSTTSVANDTVTIDINDLEEVTNYAIRIGAGAILDNFAVPYPGISDDTTWNFTSGGDPLSAALAQLTDHIDGTLTLTGSEIAARKQTIDTEKTRLDDSTALIIAALNLVSTYDTVVGPLWLNGSPVQGFDRTTVSDENIAWVVFNVMQSIMDEVYNADALADSAKRALLDGFKFGSSADFPGAISPPASPTTHTATISASFPDTFGRDTQQWTLPARKPTGCYLAPGSIVTVEVPAALVGKGIKVRVGAHSWDNEAANLKPVPRLSRATVLYDLDATSIAIASPYGGGIYLEIPKGLVLGEVDVDITGAVRSPYFSSKSFHTTTDAEWINTERNHPAPWADFQTEKFMMQVPSSWIRQLSVPTARMADWDAAMDAMNDLMGFPRDRGKETMYLQVDMILRSTVNAPGYPAVNVTYNPDTSYNGNVNHYLVQGPRLGVAWEFHEQGHAYSIPKFEGERESTANLLDVAVSNRMFGFNLDYSFAASLNFQDNPHRTLNNTAVAWMTSFNFSPREAEMQEHEKQYQLKGHAKYVDIVRLFGWESLERYWRSYNLDEENGDPLPATDDAKIIRLCEQVGEDLRPLLHFWGIFPDDPVAMQAAIDAAGLTPSREVYQRLIQYKALIPTNNANFQTFAFNWWGKQPSSSGFTTERDHARQWNTTSFFQAGDQQRSQATNPGEIYNENSAGDLHARMQEIIDLYFLNLDLT
ncbi:MAG: M60 family metallopeptidase, partial [Akkermansiaceae bacterium]